MQTKLLKNSLKKKKKKTTKKLLITKLLYQYHATCELWYRKKIF